MICVFCSLPVAADGGSATVCPMPKVVQRDLFFESSTLVSARP
jgi:hypothetical protein